jgi:Asp-tRNA(Asn)/Glu-tRNA(Gln) amidotransferase A subunit family amidase
MLWQMGAPMGWRSVLSRDCRFRSKACFAGSSRRLPAAPWEQDGPLVATLRRQLGVITGKTHMVALVFGGTGRKNHRLKEWRHPSGAAATGGRGR